MSSPLPRRWHALQCGPVSEGQLGDPSVVANVHHGLAANATEHGRGVARFVLESARENALGGTS